MLTHFKLPALGCAFAIHGTVLAMGINNVGWSHLTKLPLSMIELGFIVLCLVRHYFANVRDNTPNKQDNKLLKWLVYPNGVASTIYYYVGTYLLIYRTVIFNEFNDCLIEDCNPSREQSIIALVGTTMVWAFVDKERPMKLPKHHHHHHHKKHDITTEVNDVNDVNDVIKAYDEGEEGLKKQIAKQQEKAKLRLKGRLRQRKLNLSGRRTVPKLRLV